MDYENYEEKYDLAIGNGCHERAKKLLISANTSSK
jgi:hypothetical protein